MGGAFSSSEPSVPEGLPGGGGGGGVSWGSGPPPPPPPKLHKEGENAAF